MTPQPPSRFVLARTEVPDVYEILHIFWIESCHIVSKQENLTVIAKTVSGGSFVFKGAEAIDLLSALGVDPPTQPNPTN